MPSARKEFARKPRPSERNLFGASARKGMRFECILCPFVPPFSLLSSLLSFSPPFSSSSFSCSSSSSFSPSSGARKHGWAPPRVAGTRILQQSPPECVEIPVPGIPAPRGGWEAGNPDSQRPAAGGNRDFAELLPGMRGNPGSRRRSATTSTTAAAAAAVAATATAMRRNFWSQHTWNSELGAWPTELHELPIAGKERTAMLVTYPSHGGGMAPGSKNLK